MKKNFDAIVIGSGQSGPFLAVRMAAGKRVAIIERHRFGGTCVNTGCIPTKTLVASAYNAHMVRRAADFGVQVVGTARVDMKRVKARKDEITGKSRSGLESWLKNTPNCTVYPGHALSSGMSGHAHWSSHATTLTKLVNYLLTSPVEGLVSMGSPMDRLTSPQ